MQQIHADVLLTSIVISPEVRNTVMTRASKLALFEPLRFPEHAITWEIIKQLHNIDQEISIFHLKAAIREKYEDREKEMVGSLMTLLDNMKGTTVEDISTPVAEKYLEMALTEALKASMGARLGQVRNTADLLKALDMSSTEYVTATNKGDILIHNPLLDPERYMPEQMKVPIGVRWMDLLTDGGLIEGTLNGCLMPTGGGKTLTAIDIASEQAKRGNDVILFLYEQRVENDVSERLFCRMFDDRGIDFFRNIQYRDWSKEDKIRWKSLSEVIGPLIHIVDFTGKNNHGTGGASDINRALETLSDKGKAPKFVLVDWLWPMVTRYAAAIGITETSQIRGVANRVIDELTLISKKWDTRIMVFHQLGTEKSRANPSVQPKVTDALEYKTFANMMDTCFLAGNRDSETQVMWLLTDKNRHGQPKSMLGRMRGERGIIEPAENMIADFRGRFVDKDNMIPEPEGEEYGGNDYL